MRSLFLIVLAGLLTGCWKYDTDPVTKVPEHFTQTTGVETYTYPPLASEPIKVYYNIPAGGDISKMPILVVLHGTNRNAQSYRDAWVAHSNSRKFMVFAPEFPDAGSFAGSTGYNQGGMYSSGPTPKEKEKEKWTFSVIEALFDYIVADLGSSRHTYDMWGHSAGGQFTHRFVLFMPEARVNKAVAANSGWYTVPDLTVKYPYGLKDSPATAATLAESFSRKLYVELGTNDIDATDPDVVHTPEADAQGLYRYSRGLYFWGAAQNNSAGTIFNWSKAEVPGAAHEYRKMADGAVDLLY